MGIAASWIMVRGMPKAEVLERMGLIDTGEKLEEHTLELSYAEMPNGWLAVFTDDMDTPTPELLAELSAGGQAIGCAIEEHVMYSVARAFEDGRAVWSVEHDPDDKKNKDRTEVVGTPPAELAPIRERLWAQQVEEDAGDANCDYMFSLPPEIVYALTGFRADGEPIEGGEPVMTLLKGPPPVRRAAPARQAPSSGGGFFARLFGRR